MSPLLEIRGLVKHYPVGSRFSAQRRILRAVDGIDLAVHPGETLGLVGESGCGKSTTARMIMRLLDPTAGRILFDGQDITRLSGARLKAVRRRMQIVFQDPFASLNPRKTVERIVSDPLEIHRIGTAAERQARVYELLQRVGLDRRHADRYPHEFSGGQRQRISIARALACAPQLIVADEPVSALDVSIQAQVINLLQDLQRDLDLTMIFISHDLSVVQYVSDTIAVMYLGKIVEVGPSQAIYHEAQHPYTRSLLSAIPVPDPTRRRSAPPLESELPSPINIPSGCRFHPRCPLATERCRREAPEFRMVGAQQVACHNI
ncbi:MAG: dipeptide ABC transporter ATP-binding protein [Chloroflexaceae bacterium]|nr:dipeptide ABC transporter ATP-binding protein [Chloroflexaceae bacterium]